MGAAFDCEAELTTKDRVEISKADEYDNTFACLPSIQAPATT